MLIEKIEYEGKQWIEFNFKFQVVLGMIIALTLIMLSLCAYLYFTSDEIKTDPFIFGAKLYKVSYCNCLTESGNNFLFNQTDIGDTWGKMK